MITSYPPQKRPSWRGVLAGLLMGLIVVMAMIALALVLSSFLPFSLQGTSIAAGIYTAIVSAYVAGYFAVKYSAPETLFGDGTEIDPKDATLTGMLAAASMIALTTVMAVNGATGILSSATNAVGSTVSTVANTTATAAGGVATAVGTAAGQSDTNVQQEAKNVYDKVVGDISRSDVEKWVAKNSQNLDQEQVNATTTVITQLVNEQKAEVKSLDFTDLDTWKNLDEIAKKRLADVQQTLESDEIITRLQTAGLSEPEAKQVRTEVVASYNEYKAQTEQMVASASEKANQALYQAEDVARKTALYTGLFWLISSLLTFLASIAGARSAAANYRLDKPIVTLGDNVR